MPDEPKSPDLTQVMEILNRQREITTALGCAVEKAGKNNKLVTGIIMHLRNLEERVANLEKRGGSTQSKRRQQRGSTVAKRSIK